MYRLRPSLKVSEPMEVTSGMPDIVKTLKKVIMENGHRAVAIEAFPGIGLDELQEELQKQLPEARVLSTDTLFLAPEVIFADIQKDLTEDKVFGRFSQKDFTDFIDPLKLNAFYKDSATKAGSTILVGVAASQIIDYDFLVYMDIPRWEVQLRYKRGLSNWQGYKERDFSEKLKRAYYFEWPAGQFVREEVLPKCHFYLDMTNEEQPKMITGLAMRGALQEFTQQPFRLVPFFDPGIWGGTWMQEKFQVGQEEVNLAWCFDGVPEENSILIQVGEMEVEMPAQNLVSLYPEKVLGRKVFGKYGKDFPIRFDYLDTMDGQNLSLQVHPTFDYAYRKFGAKYTQDESYYILDCKADAEVYLGIKEGVQIPDLIEALEEAQETGEFDDKRYINSIPVKKHDHLLIPGGTIHSSGKNCVVLEISATPNRFTFKLWDWGRVDLNGKPRPISIHHGKHVINPDIDEKYVAAELYNNVHVIDQGEGFQEEHTGLHELESIETRRLTFSKPIRQTTEKSVNMLNLVEGEHIQVHSPTEAFPPFDVYYGETFIIPEAVEEYSLVPMGGDGEVKVMKAYIR